MKNAITFQQTGLCDVDIDKAKKQWNLLCRIYQHNNTYTLVEFTLKGKQKLKVRISEYDALTLINMLNLICIDDTTFKNSKKYLIV